MSQSLLTGWIEPAHIHDKGWVLDWLIRLNPHKVKNCGSIDPVTGAWRFEFPDQVQAKLPASEIIYRPFSADENEQWKKKSAKQWVADAKAHLEGRRFRVTFCCEPAPSEEEFPAFMHYSVELMEECDKQDLLIDMWGFPAQYLKMFTNDPRDITKGGWNTPLQVAGALRGTVLINIHCYTWLSAPAGTYEDNYLRQIATVPELLRDESSWATYEDIESRPYQTRHLFRDLWLNRWAKEIGAPEHDLFTGESIYDYFGDEHDLQETKQRATAIAGDDLNVCLPTERKVGGIRTLPNFMKWKHPQWTFQESIIKQLRWHGNIRARNPRYKGYALYMLSDKDGDQRPHNWLAHKDILDACVGLNPIAVFDEQPTPPAQPPPPPPPPVVVETSPTIIALVRPTVDILNFRIAPSLNDTVIGAVTDKELLKVIAPENALQLIGLGDKWLKVITQAGTIGYVAAWMVRAELPPKPVTIRDLFPVNEQAEIDAAVINNPAGMTARLAVAGGWKIPTLLP